MKNFLRTYIPSQRLDQTILAAAHDKLRHIRLMRSIRRIAFFTTSMAACMLFGIFGYAHRLNVESESDIITSVGVQPYHAKYAADQRPAKVQSADAWDLSGVENEIYNLSLTLDNSQTTLASLQ